MELAPGTRGEERGGAAVVTVTIAWLPSGHPHWRGSAPRFPAGFVTSGTDGGRCSSWPWGSASPSVPEPGSSSSSRPARLLVKPCQPDPALIQGVCKKPGSYKFGLCWRQNGYGAGTVGGLLCDRQLRGRGAPAPGTRCRLPGCLWLFSAPLRISGSAALLPSVTPPPCWGYWALLGELQLALSSLGACGHQPPAQRSENRWVFLHLGYSHHC